MNRTAADLVPVLDVGGTHVSAAVVDVRTGEPAGGPPVRLPLRSDAPAAAVLDALADAALTLGPGHGRVWGVALPGPFDYAAGVGRYRGTGKFEALHGVDVGAGLRRRLADRALDLHFLNDADAFAVGEHRSGAAAGLRRVLVLTLGTGVGSCFLDDGVPVREGPDVPPGGEACRLTLHGRPLEESVSRRAIRLRYAALVRPAAPGTPDALPAEGPLPDVREIAGRARRGDRHAVRAVVSGCEDLGRALGPWCDRFGAAAVVVGGSIAGSWDLVGPALARGLGAVCPHPPEPRPAARPDTSALTGAADWALRRSAAVARRPAAGTPPAPSALPGGAHPPAPEPPHPEPPHPEPLDPEEGP
ncbi:ROK family protein [Streptacidiphilus sp. ASG 303]|uniref:ROK family protein n=1 Tax=Streptacidiphilus sp. ASG 303 TaxID=2896847 RepID=UPI001E449220|nr:ROK family protein [Streptacidiphilus sp. ASG 303]MCD0483565.1 ROK family protein [Streptacidiphilus sp. ASG 303]